MTVHKVLFAALLAAISRDPAAAGAVNAALQDLAAFAPPAGENTRYHAAGNAVIGIGRKRFFNRPHCTNHTAAAAWRSPADLAAGKPDDHALIVGLMPLADGRPAHWSFTRHDRTPAGLADDTEPEALFAAGLARSADFASRLDVRTPDPRVNAAAAMAVAGIDGMWYGNRFVHGSMSWNSPYLGWRTTIGGTMLGWHDRVKTSVDTCHATQVTGSNNTSGAAMGVNGGRDYLLTKPGLVSRFSGKGYIRGDHTFYEMQTQCFDRVLQDWRWRLTDDPAHEAKLRKGVELHLERLRECYDPADPGCLVTPQGVPFLWGGPTKNGAFASLWDNWPDRVTVPVNQSGDAAWFLICGSTTVMQTRVANAVLRLNYADGVEETLERIPPCNYWNLSPVKGMQARAQFGASYYTEATEAFTVPKPWPMTVEPGTNCRAMVLNRRLRPGVRVDSLTLKALSQESVIGLMGVSVMRAPP